MPKALFTNNSASLLVSDITNIATTLTVTASDGALFALPLSGDRQAITLTDLDETTHEVVYMTGRSGDVLTVTRGEEGTTAVAWASGTRVEARMTAETAGQFVQDAIGGDARGLNAVNIQPTRSLASRVASGASAIAIGEDAEASGDEAVAIGLDTIASNQSAVAIGQGPTASGSGGIAIGVFAEATGISSTTVGQYTLASQTYATALGYQANAIGINSTALGRQANAGTQDSVAIGERANVTGYGATGIGSEAQGTGDYSHAIGDSATASGDYSISLGYQGTSAGLNAISIGPNTDADTPHTIAIGNSTLATQHQTLALWAATTAYTAGDRVKIAADTNYWLVAVYSGTTGASEPVVTGDINSTVIDGTVTWMVLYTTAGTAGESNIAIGDGTVALGTESVAIGNDTAAEGNKTIAVGWQAKATGAEAIAIGQFTRARGYRTTLVGGNINVSEATRYGVGLGNYSEVIGRDVEAATNIGASNPKYLPFDHAISMTGFEFAGQHDWLFVGSADAVETTNQTMREVTVHSIPVQAGDEAWVANTSYKHGDCVVPTGAATGYSYVAYIWNAGDYFESGTSHATTEPIWPTTPGDNITDNDIEWICVDLDNIQFVLPDYARFTPTSVGVMTRTCSAAATTQPAVSFGINGDLDKWLVATTLTKMTGTGASEFLEPTNTEYAKQFGGAVTTAGTGVDCQLMLVLKGYVIEIDAI